MTTSTRPHSHFAHGAVSLATLAFAISAGQAVAATAKKDTANASGDVNEVVVTAQFRSAKLQDTPIAITAVNSAMLEARSQTNLSAVADQAPNVNLSLIHI